MEKKYRHELKYLISEAQISLLRCRLNGIMKSDPHVGPAGIYNIRSLYFDTYNNQCFYENENGTDPREKFRIRIYNHSSSHITLECKRKERGKTLKTSCPLTLDQTQQLMEGKILKDQHNLPPLLQKLQIQMQTQLLRPVVIVEYDRTPYVYKVGNVRITFDTNVTSCSDVSSFLSENLSKRPIMPRGQHLMEVKFDEFLPDFIYHSLNLEHFQQTAYSKYYLCRKYKIHK